MKDSRSRSNMSPPRRAGWLMLCLLLLLMSLPPATHAAPIPPATHQTAHPKAALSSGTRLPLSDLLQEDGTLRDLSGWEGSVDPSGYRLVSGSGEAPRFAPAALSPNEESWTNYAVNGPVYALAYGDGKLYVGGEFSVVGDTTSASNVAMWNPATSTWSALGSGANNGVSGEPGFVYALAYGDGMLYVGGEFTTVGGTISASRVAMWNPATSTWSSLGSGPNNGVAGTVFALAYGDGMLYVGGNFPGAGSIDANNLVMWNPTTSTWSIVGTGNDNGVGMAFTLDTAYALTYVAGKLYVGGIFSDAGGTVPANNLAMWDSATNTWSPLGSGANNGVDGVVFALAYGDSKLFAGGNFTTAAGSLPADRVAMWNPATSTWSALGSGANNGVDSSVYALAYGSGKLFVGGAFTTAGGSVSANRVASWNPATNGWAALGTGLNNTVNALTIGSLWAGSDSGLSEWSAALAATLATFESQVGSAEEIEVVWETASERNNAGFHLWRATSADATPTRITGALIPAQLPGSSHGARYTWRDSDVVPGTTYFYWLEDISLSGDSTRHGPISATLATPTALTLGSLTGVAGQANAVAGIALLLLAGLVILRRLR